MAITVLVILEDVSTALLWRSLSISETIGQPDTLTVDLLELNDAVRTLLQPPERYLYTHVYRDTELLFSGVALGVKRRNQKGAVIYSMSAIGWEFLVPRRKVGTPYTWSIPPEEEWDGPLPEPIWVDPRAIAAPVPAQVKALWTAYWLFPSIDLDTWVLPLLPEGVPTPDQMTWSGSDLAGATSDLCAAASAAAMWWLANDSPSAGDAVAPHLALHVGLTSLPEEDDDDLVIGLPIGDEPIVVAPYEITDDPDPDDPTQIMASVTPELDVDQRERVGGSYVRGATGNVLVVVPGGALGYTIAEEQEGGTGWVGAPGTEWGEDYVEAPAAISRDQRDAFGTAHLAASSIPAVSGTIPVDIYGGFHKGQAVRVTDAGLGLTRRWLLIRGVSIQINDPDGEAPSYSIQVGDALTAQLGYALRVQRLAETRKPIHPANQFVAWMAHLSPDPGTSLKAIMQLATDNKAVRRVAGVGASWSMLVDGDWLEDPFDDTNLFWLTDATFVTNELGQVSATMNASADSGSSEARVKADVVLS